MAINMKNINTAEQAEKFLKDCGFIGYHSVFSGVGEYIADKENDELYCYQINGEDITRVADLNEAVIFTINGKDPSITPLYSYSKEYYNFKEMIDGEKHRNIFNEGFKNWKL